MVTGIGVPAITGTDGAKIGRSALDDRLMVYADYTSLGIIRGCKVYATAAGMKWKIEHGNANMSIAVASRSAADGASKFPIVAQVIDTTAAPASGARLDVIYARQNRPDLGDPDNQVIVGVVQGNASANPATPTLPAGAVVLATYRVPSGISNTLGATLVEVGPQAVPYGAALGVLVSKTYTANQVQIKDSAQSLLSARFKLTEPRLLCFQLTCSARALAPIRPDKTEVAMRVLVDGVEIREMRFALDAAPGTFQYSEYRVFGAGTHTVAVNGNMANGNGQWMYAAGKWPGQIISVIDHGVNDG